MAIRLFIKSIIFITLIYITSCTKKECRKEDGSEGIIVEDLDYNCSNDHKDKTYIIDSDTAASRQIVGGVACPDYFNADKIDFHKYTLLGQYASGKCNAKFSRIVERIEQEKRYHYKMIVYECGACKKERVSLNLILVPKLPIDWDVTFSIEKIQD